MKQKQKIYLIDGSAFIYRAYHAVAPLSNSAGLPTHAIFGFHNILKRVLKEKAPSHIAVIFDAKGPVFRHEMYSEYKANRPPMPDDLVVQIPYIKELVTAFGICSLELAGVEADDLIATATQILKKQDCEVVVVSGDKDLFQLVDEQVVVWEPMRDRIIDVQAVKDKYKVGPSQLLDCYALIGDSSDNVPGVPGVGPKTAEKLINQYQSLDGVYEHLDQMKKSKLKERLESNRDAAFLSRDLIRLKMDVDVPTEIDAYRLAEPNKKDLQKLYKELEFVSFLESEKKRQELPRDSFTLVQTEEGFDKVLSALDGANLIVLDTETTSVDARNATLVGLSLAVSPAQSWYIPLAHKNKDGTIADGQLAQDKVIEGLRPYFESDSVVKLGHNIKYDYTVLQQCCDIGLGGPLYDTMIAAYLLAPVRRSYKLDDLCLDIGFSLTPFTAVVDDPKKEGCFAFVDVAAAGNYSCEDVFGTLMLWQEFEPRLNELGLMKLFCEVETPLVAILAEMETTGITVSTEVLQELSHEFLEKLDVLEQEIYSLAGHTFNIQSPKQLGVILFEELQLPHGRKTKTGYSTDMKVLEKLADKHELPAKIIQFRTIAKLQSTYVEKLQGLIDSKTGRVHTSFNQTVTATGRLSSSNPNLQNIPIRSEDGNRIRAAFIPEKDKLFLSADYSQIDLRVLAHYSQDKALLAAFNRGEDIHGRTAAELFSVSPLLITKEMRRVAKGINFGIVYGMSSFGLAKQLDISRREAQRFIDKYFALYSGVKHFMGDIIEEARSKGYVTTLYGRRRMLPEINIKNKTRREFAERTAINSPIQGTAADIVKLAMIKVERLLEKKGLQAKLLLQIHDELVFELPDYEVEDTRAVVQEAMESAMELDVPLVVNFELGKNLAKSG